MKNILFFLKIGLIIFLFTTSGISQVDFVGSESYFNNQSKPSFIPKVFTDLNGDFRDDVMLVDGKSVYKYVYSQQSDSLYLDDTYLQGSSESWAQGAMDLDNDGVPEMFYSGFYDGVFIYKENAESYNLSQQLNSNIFAQAFSIADINNDGNIDLFLCNDDGLSSIFINDGTGVLVDQSSLIDMRTNPASDNSGNYGSIWTDIDGDNDLDLYIAKCRLGITSITDMRRVNALFINNGDGTFTEEAAERNVASGFQSWAADYGDFNRDGSLDLFVVNHDAPNQLFYNDGNGVFTEDLAFRDLVSDNGLGYQAMVVDIDNNGWEDIVVAGGPEIIYYNEGGIFSAITGSATTLIEMATAAYGDINEDGFIDFYTGANGLGGFSNTVDRIFANQGNSNHYFTLSLQGTVSNRQGIGAIVKLYNSDGAQMRQHKAGTSYSIQNTANQHFGLGQNTAIDSIVINWPSGIVDVYTDINADSHLLAIEGNCINLLPELTTQEDPTLCDGVTGESIEITSSVATVNWNTGDSGASLTTTESGLYQVTTADNCQVPSNVLKIHGTPVLEDPMLNIEGDVILCSGDFFTAQVLNYDEVIWQNGITSQAQIIAESTTLQASVASICETVESNLFNVAFVDTLVLENISVEEEQGDIILDSGLDSGLTQTIWYEDALGTQSIGTGQTLQVNSLVDVTYYYQSVPDILPPTAQVGFSFEESDIQPNNFGQNGFLFLNAQRDLTIKSVDVQVDEPGKRIITLILSSTGTVIDSKEVTLNDLGRQTIELDFDLEQGENYRISTDTDSNQAEFGVDHPHFGYHFNPDFPIHHDSWITFTNSSFPSIYFYFYDIQIEQQHSMCLSDIASYEVNVVLSDTDDISPNDTSLLAIPNPATENISFEIDQIIESNATLSIFNLMGKRVHHNTKYNGSSLSINNWPSGQYLVQLTTEGRVYTTRFNKD